MAGLPAHASALPVAGNVSFITLATPPRTAFTVP